MRVMLTEPGVAGRYLITEQRADGGLVLEPEAANVVERIDADVASGRTSYFDSDEELDAALVARSKRLDSSH